MTEEEFVSTSTGCLPKVFDSWQQFFANFNINHPIYPLDPVAPKHSEFFIINSKIHIRVIHVRPENAHKLVLRRCSNDRASKRNSLAEEYWFMKWNKPIKPGNCSCSFRRSFRLSQISNHSSKLKNEEDVGSFELTPKRIINVETFVERIVQETIFEAFQEYFIIKNREKGIINLAFDEEVLLRKRQFILNNSVSQKHHCLHKHVQNKPFIILLHGIGNTADIWWSVIYSLVSKGYEVIAPDMLGHGYSAAPNKANSYTFHNLLFHAITIFDHYTAKDEKKKCILIGHSYGSSLATALYRHRANQISQLILISGGGPTPLAAPVRKNEISPFGCVHTLLKPFLFCGLKRSFLFSSRGKHFDVCDSNTGIPPHIIEYLSMGQNWPEGDAAFHRRILVPTLLVHGLQDKKITLVQQCEMERTIPRAFLELIPNAGHMAMLETPEHLSHMILCFIESWN